jgi:hypothetical protein
MFALIFGFWAHPRYAGSGFPLQFASLRFASQIPLQSLAFGLPPPFAMEAHALRASPQVGLHALRANIPKAAFTSCLQVRKRRLAYAPALIPNFSLIIVNSFLSFTFSFFLVYSSLLIVNL